MAIQYDPTRLTNFITRGKTLNQRLTIAVRMIDDLHQARQAAYPDQTNDECTQYAYDSTTILTNLDAWQIQEHATQLAKLDAAIEQATLTSGGHA